MKVVVIDYGMGNLHSVSKALETAGAEVLVSNRSGDLEMAEGIVLPGVGSFVQGMKHLVGLDLIDKLYQEVIIKKKPFLGICLGMQLAAKTGEEGGSVNGLGWIDAKVIRFDFQSNEYKVPHMGWDDVKFVGVSPLFAGLDSPATLYFVHSYHFVPADRKIVTGVCDYGDEFVVSVSKDNIHLFQFHPEKSQAKGLKILANFIDMYRNKE